MNNSVCPTLLIFLAFVNDREAHHAINEACLVLMDRKSQPMPYIQPDVITVRMWLTLDSASPSIPLTDDIISGYR